MGCDESAANEYMNRLEAEKRGLEVAFMVLRGERDEYKSKLEASEAEVGRRKEQLKMVAVIDRTAEVADLKSKLARARVVVEMWAGRPKCDRPVPACIEQLRDALAGGS